MTGHFEAKKIAWRQTKDGLVVALLVHPDELPQELALAPLNTRFMIGYSEIGDDEKPVVPTASEPKANGSSKKFHNFPLSQQAAIRCGDALFQEYLKREDAVGAADEVRLYCEVESRSQINLHADSGARWLQLESKYQSWLTDRKFAEAKR